MGRWAAIFEDKRDALWIRERHNTDHFTYLAANSGKIALAGGLRPDEGEPYRGGLWILEVENRQGAMRLCEEDPYFKLGLRSGYRLFRWGKAPVYGDVAL